MPKNTEQLTKTEKTVVRKKFRALLKTGTPAEILAARLYCILHGVKVN